MNDRSLGFPPQDVERVEGSDIDDIISTLQADIPSGPNPAFFLVNPPDPWHELTPQDTITPYTTGIPARPAQCVPLLSTFEAPFVLTLTAGALQTFDSDTSALDPGVAVFNPVLTCNNSLSIQGYQPTFEAPFTQSPPLHPPPDLQQVLIIDLQQQIQQLQHQIRQLQLQSAYQQQPQSQHAQQAVLCQSLPPSQQQALYQHLTPMDHGSQQSTQLLTAEVLCRLSTMD